MFLTVRNRTISVTVLTMIVLGLCIVSFNRPVKQHYLQLTSASDIRNLLTGKDSRTWEVSSVREPFTGKELVTPFGKGSKLIFRKDNQMRNEDVGRVEYVYKQAKAYNSRFTEGSFDISLNQNEALPWGILVSVAHTKGDSFVKYFDIKSLSRHQLVLYGAYDDRGRVQEIHLTAN
jgi:hypothetical protein